MADSPRPVPEVEPVTEEGAPPALPRDASREHMMRRVAELPLEARIALFEALSRDAAWARSAVRVR